MTEVRLTGSLHLPREVVPGLCRLAIMANVELSSAALEMSQVQAAARTCWASIRSRWKSGVPRTLRPPSSRSRIARTRSTLAPICEWIFLGVAATSIGHRFLPMSWSLYSRMCGTPLTAALQRETRTIPIVFATVLAKRRAETYDCLETC